VSCCKSIYQCLVLTGSATLPFGEHPSGSAGEVMAIVAATGCKGGTRSTHYGE